MTHTYMYLSEYCWVVTGVVDTIALFHQVASGSYLDALPVTLDEDLLVENLQLAGHNNRSWQSTQVILSIRILLFA